MAIFSRRLAGGSAMILHWSSRRVQPTTGKPAA